MKNIIITGASGVVGYGCLKSLRDNPSYNLIGTSIYDSLIVKKFSNEFIIAPHTNDDDYIVWLKNVINENNINFIIPGIDIDMYKLNDYRIELEELGVNLMLNNSKLINLCKDKWAFYKKLKIHNKNVCIRTDILEIYDTIVEKFSSPFLIKPRNGYGSKDIHVIKNKKEFDFYFDKDKYIIQELIIGEEYTIGAFFDVNHNLVANISMKRKLSSGGYTEESEIIFDNELDIIVRNLGDYFEAIGPTNFQFIKDEQGYKLLEINPRISSSTAIRTQFNYNECDMGTNFFCNGIVPTQPKILKGKAIRYVEEIIKYDRDNI